MKRPASKAEHTIRNDPRVGEISDERNMGDGLWIYLRPGYWNKALECTCVHEPTWTKCLREFRYVEADPRPDDER